MGDFIASAAIDGITITARENRGKNRFEFSAKGGHPAVAQEILETFFVVLHEQCLFRRKRADDGTGYFISIPTEQQIRSCPRGAKWIDRQAIRNTLERLRTEPAPPMPKSSFLPPKMHARTPPEKHSDEPGDLRDRIVAARIQPVLSAVQDWLDHSQIDYDPEKLREALASVPVREARRGYLPMVINMLEQAGTELIPAQMKALDDAIARARQPSPLQPLA